MGNSINWVCKSLVNLPRVSVSGNAFQPAAQESDISFSKVVPTDPPYYDNISYADLSDFFYVWLRKSLQNHYPQIFQRSQFRNQKSWLPCHIDMVISIMLKDFFLMV